MKYLSVCSGIEAASKAWEPIGWKPVAFSEIEPFPSAVLKHHWPEVPNLGDMSKYEQWNIPSGSVDILVGGTPCQSFSVAGLRQGLKDPRGNLMLTFLAIAERLKPRWLVWENVPGVLSSNGGKDFGSFLGALGELGYEWAYRVLDAQWFGVAQRRRRVFVVAHLGEGSLAAKVLFESESVRRDTAPSREARKGVASNVAPSLTASNDPSRSPQSSEVTQQVNAVLEASIVSPTITQYKGSRGGCSSEAISEISAVQQATAFRMQAFGEYSDDGTASAMKAGDYKDATDLITEPVAYNITFCDANGTRSDRPDGGLYVNKTDVTGSLTRAGIGTNVVQPVVAPVVIDRAAFNQGENAQYKPHIEHSETMDSLVARGPHAVLFENHPNDSRVTGPHDVAPSCVSRYGTGGGNVPLVQEAVSMRESGQGYWMEDNKAGTLRAEGENRPSRPSNVIAQVAVAVGCFKSGQGATARSIGYSETLSPTLSSNAGGNTIPAVAVDTYNQCLQDKAAPIRSTASDVCHTGGVINPADRMAVRRLTPRECERLQGFNDDHTLIPWRNKPADQCPDGPRYKALGNSMAVPCMAWIGKRIDAVERKTK